MTDKRLLSPENLRRLRSFVASDYAWVRLLDYIEAQAKRIEELEAKLAIEWIPCKKRMPDNSRDVWVHPAWNDGPELEGLIAPIAAWCGEWWGGGHELPLVEITHWAEIRWPKPPEKEQEE